MRSEKLGLEHKELLFGRLKKIGSPISEYSFANLYLFRKIHRYSVILDGEIFIKGVSYDAQTYLMLTSHPRTMDMNSLREGMRDVDFLFPVEEEWLPFFDPAEFRFTWQAGDSDYMYTTEKMITYSGRRLHVKRNLLSRFKKNYSHEAHPLTRDRMSDARRVLEQWQAGSGHAGTDYETCLEALDRYDELVLCGGIYYADGEPAGFILGEELTPETFVIHFAKGVKRFKGIYQYIFNNFAGILPKKYRYLNFEQDLDKENLRIAKASYQPDLMVKKMRVSLKK